MRRTAKTFAFIAFSVPLCRRLLLARRRTYRQTAPLDPANLDRTANACVDFYQFANGGWIKNNPIPAAFSRWGSFNELEEKNNSELTKILERAAADNSANRSATVRMLGTYYSSCMDSAAAEKAGAEPLRPRLTRIASISDRTALQRELAQLHLKA